MKNIEVYLKKYAPTVLSFLACGGVVGTGVLAVKNYKKANERITMEKIEQGRKLTEKEETRLYIQSQIPTILTATATMACIMGSNGLNAHYQAGLISAYGLINESYKEYRDKVIEFHGPEEHKRIIDSIAAENANPPYINARGAFSAPSLDASELSKEDQMLLFYDEFSKRYFRSTLAAVIQAEYHINRNWCLGEVVTLNEWYEFLGLEQTIEGNELGWFMGAEDEYFWLDFDHEVKHLEDGSFYVSISVEYPPTTDWQELW